MSKGRLGDLYRISDSNLWQSCGRVANLRNEVGTNIKISWPKLQYRDYETGSFLSGRWRTKATFKKRNVTVSK